MADRAREAVKAAARALALVAVSPMLLSYFVRARLLGRDRALEGSSQLLSLVPGIPGQYVRRAFLQCTLAYCAPTAVVEFGTIFSATGARLEERVYIGPFCAIGLAHLERDVLVAPAVQIPSGRLTHGIAKTGVPIQDQPGTHVMVRIGEGTWIGGGAVVMADVGRGTVVGAGAVVTRPLPDGVVAGGIPARSLRSRAGTAEAPNVHAFEDAAS